MNCGNLVLDTIEIETDLTLHLIHPEDHLKNLFFDHSYRKNPAAQLDDVNVGECGNNDSNFIFGLKNINFILFII